MKTKLFLSLIVGCTVALSGCSSLFSSNNSNQPSAKELEEFHKYEKDLYNRLSASMIEPAKKEDRFERQIVNEFFSSQLDRCGYHNYVIYKSNKCNLNELAPYDVEVLIPVLNVEKGSKFKGQVEELLVLSDYVPGKSVKIVKYNSNFDKYYVDFYDMTRFIRYRNTKYYHYKHDEVLDLTPTIPAADFNFRRYKGFSSLNLEERKIYGSVNTFNFSKEDNYESWDVPYVKNDLELTLSLGLPDPREY